MRETTQLCGLLQGCPPHVVETLLDAGTERDYPVASVIFSEGDPVTGVYCHVDGDIRIYVERDGLRHEVDRSRPGALLGYREPERYGVYIVTAVALSPARLFYIPLDVFSTVLRTSPHLMLNVMRSLSARIDGLEEQLVTGA
jgi:CRP-like cAMP-binding protein